MRLPYKWKKRIKRWAKKIDYDIHREVDTYRNKRPNILGICNCPRCIRGRAGIKDGQIMRLKRKLHNWKSNKPAKKGAYTD